jgi:hypothetical protein
MHDYSSISSTSSLLWAEQFKVCLIKNGIFNTIESLTDLDSSV